jgi:D-alanyl-D-alanine carboxypeptidase
LADLRARFRFGLAAALIIAAAPASAVETPALQRPVVGPHLLVDAETGTVLSHADAVRPWFPASTTKLMTAYVAFRAIQNGELTLDAPVVISERAAAEPPSKMGFKPGTSLTLDNALKIMMVKSANDIAMAVAETVGGSKEGFAERMNAESARLGMVRSKWVNPHGLPDPGQVTTARDMAVLARALLNEFPQHRDYYKLHAIQFGKSVLKNFNPLLERYPGANGMKTGFICASGYNLVASARRGDRELVAVVFGAYGGEERAEQAAALLEQGFATPRPLPEPAPSLGDVASGASYVEPIDMRPHVCAPNQAKTAQDAPQPEEPKVVAASAAGPMAGDVEEETSPLGPPIYLGPPVPVSIIAAGGKVKPGMPGFVARVPRSRPADPSG